MSTKNEQIKKGRTCLIWAVVCLVISYVMYLAELGDAIAAVVNFAMVVLFIGGLAYLIIGLVKKGCHKKDAFGKEKSAMRVRKISIMIYIVIIGLLIAGCGPSYLSEVEFVENAKGTCQTLSADISALDELDFAGKAAAYRRASDELNEFEISEESAPQGVLLRKGLSELAEVQESFANALKEALANADMDSAATLLITEDGNVFASESGSSNIFEFLQNATQLDINNEIVLDMNTKLMAVKDVATVLDLNDCAPGKIENNE